MNSETHEFRREVYAIEDAELPPPTDEAYRYPWEFVSMVAIPGYPNGLFHDGKYPRMVVVWARRKGNPRDDQRGGGS